LVRALSGWFLALCALLAGSMRLSPGTAKGFTLTQP
jgi:hypothetical protein